MSCVTTNLELSIPLGLHCSIYLAEVAAIIKCCQAIVSSGIINQRISIYTDSQSAIKALTSPKISSALTLRCWESLENLSSINSVNLTWVPGHSAIPGNEKADALARQGALTTVNALPEPLIGIPTTTIKRNINNYKYQEFCNYWRNQDGCKQSKKNVPLRKNHSKFLINLSRTRLKVYTGVMTGHFDFNKHLANIGKRQDSGCDYCGERIDSSDHFLCHCPAFISSRHKCLGNFILKSGTIKTLHPKDILSYICSTGRFHSKYGV